MAAEFLGVLVRLNLAAALAILVILALRKPLRRLVGARLAYGLWVVLPLAMAACLLPARTFVPLAPPSLPLGTAAEAAIQWVSGPQTTAVALAPASHTSEPAILLLCLWGLGAALGLAAVAFVQRRSVARLGTLRATGDATVMQADRAGFGPALVGVLPPRIVIPADFESSFSAGERTVILAHEQVHLARGDGLVNAVLVLCQCLNWFNPLIHLAARILRLDQELACDATVMARHPDARRAYAEALLKTQLAPVPLPLACYWPARGDNPLKERLVMLKKIAPGRRRKIAGAVCIVAVATASGYAAWASSPKVETLAGELAPRFAERSLAAGSSAMPSSVPVATAPREVRPNARSASAIAKGDKQLSAAKALYQNGLLKRSELGELAASLGRQARSGLAPSGLEATSVGPQEEYIRLRARLEPGLATRLDLISAAERLGDAQLRLGQETTGYDEALSLARSELDAMRKRHASGVSSLTDLGRAEARVNVLEPLAKP